MTANTTNTTFHARRVFDIIVMASYRFVVWSSFLLGILGYGTATQRKDARSLLTPYEGVNISGKGVVTFTQPIQIHGVYVFSGLFITSRMKAIEFPTIETAFALVTSANLESIHYVRYVNSTEEDFTNENATAIVRENFVGKEYDNFTADQTLLLTLTNMTGENGSFDATAQLAIIAGQNMTFVMCQFNNMNYSNLQEFGNICWELASFQIHRRKATTQILSLGNTGVPGRWIFRVDQGAVSVQYNILPRASGICIAAQCLCYGGYAGQYCATTSEHNCDVLLELGPSSMCVNLPQDSTKVVTTINPCIQGNYSASGESYNCTCDEGYEGTHCDVNIDDCRGNNCSSQGVCLDDIGNYTCECFPGYSGNNCHVFSDPCVFDPCYYGDCNPGGNGLYNCSCDPGYTGRDCEVDIDDCFVSPCVQGVCLDEVNGYICSCYPGYSGSTCESNIDDCLSVSCVYGYCQDGLNNSSCVCGPGYEGIRCDKETNECASNPCHHGGTCNDLVNHYTCGCPPGYTGIHCEVDINECASNPCVNGDCVQGVNAFTCQRCPGYTGVRCEQQVDYCLSSPCKSAGTCRPVPMGYVCDCVDGVMGASCETDTRVAVGTFDNWQDWSAASCSKTCDTGMKQRYRQCMRGPCLETNCQTQSCLVVPCPGDALASSNSVRLVTSKPLLDVVGDEIELRASIADLVNAHCVKNAAICCRDIASGVLSFDPLLTVDNVAMAAGYPRVDSDGQVSIRVVVEGPARLFQTACRLTANRRRRDVVTGSYGALQHQPIVNPQEGTAHTSKLAKSRSTRHAVDTVFLPQDVLQEIIDANIPSLNINQNLCCFSVKKPEERGVTKTTNVIIACVVPIGVVVIILLLLIFGLAVANRKKNIKAQHVISGNTSNKIQYPLTMYYVPPAPQGRTTKPIAYRSGPF